MPVGIDMQYHQVYRVRRLNYIHGDSIKEYTVSIGLVNGYNMRRKVYAFLTKLSNKSFKVLKSDNYRITLAKDKVDDSIMRVMSKEIAGGLMGIWSYVKI